MRTRFEHEEKPFDPERRYPREARQHHFSVNAQRRNPHRRNHGNVTQLHAQPYAGGAGFYMKSSQDWERGYQKGLRNGVEEYEIQFIDGPEYLGELFRALGIDQSSVELWFDTVEHLDESEAAGFYALASFGTSSAELLEAIEREEQPDVILYQGSLEEVAAEMIDEMDHQSRAALAEVYFDWERYGEYTENSLATGSDEQSYESWREIVDENDGSEADAVYETVKDQWGTDAHGGPRQAFFQEMDEGELRDFMDDEAYARDLDIEGAREFSFGGSKYVFIPQ